MKIEIYTDGSALIAKKPGGYGWVLVVNGIKHSEGHGRIPKADNNDAELEAALRGLDEVARFVRLEKQKKETREHEFEIVFYSDSSITLSWANGTYLFKQEAKYKKFERIKELVQTLNIKTQWVRAHAGQEHNERCDTLASLGRLNQTASPSHTL